MRTWTTAGGSTVTRIMSGPCNLYLLASDGAALLVDTGRRRSRRVLFARLDAKAPSRLGAVVLTHTHFDHAESAAAICERYGAKVVVHAAEADGLRKGINPPTDGTNPLARLLARALTGPLRARFEYEPCGCDVRVEERLDLGPFGFHGYLVHTPGHSPGSMSLILEDELALVGDTLFGIFPGAVFPPFADDVGRLVASWARLLETPCRVFLPGHGRPIERRLLERCYRGRHARAAGGVAAA